MTEYTEKYDEIRGIIKKINSDSDAVIAKEFRDFVAEIFTGLKVDIGEGRVWFENNPFTMQVYGMINHWTRNNRFICIGASDNKVYSARMSSDVNRFTPASEMCRLATDSEIVESIPELTRDIKRKMDSALERLN